MYVFVRSNVALRARYDGLVFGSEGYSIHWKVLIWFKIETVLRLRKVTW
jgi:hypothetical protein